MLNMPWLFKGESFIDVDPGDAPQTLLERTGGSYRVGIGRWFGSDGSGTLLRPSDEEPAFVVLCDFNAVPLQFDGSRFVLPVIRTKSKSSRIGFEGPSRLRVLYLADSVNFTASELGLALDAPVNDGRNDNLLDATILTTDGHLLPDQYLCQVRSQRATVKITPDNELSFIGLVGSRYTVLQNIVLAEDAWELLRRGGQLAATGLVDSGSVSPRIRGGNEGAFYGLSVGFASDKSVGAAPGNGISLELDLFHSHDTAYTYTNFLVLWDTLVAPGVILHVDKIKIKHTRNIGNRVERVSDVLEQVEDAVVVFLSQRDVLADCGVNERGKELVDFVLEHFDAHGRNWLAGRIVEVFESEEYSGKYGRNCWTLYRAISAVEGGYWDYRPQESGLPALLEVTDAYKRRASAMQSLLKHAMRFAQP